MARINAEEAGYGFAFGLGFATSRDFGDGLGKPERPEAVNKETGALWYDRTR